MIEPSSSCTSWRRRRAWRWTSGSWSRSTSTSTRPCACGRRTRCAETTPCRHVRFPSQVPLRGHTCMMFTLKGTVGLKNCLILCPFTAVGRRARVHREGGPAADGEAPRRRAGHAGPQPGKKTPFSVDVTMSQHYIRYFHDWIYLCQTFWLLH